MSGPMVTRVEASTDVDVYKSWFAAETTSPKKIVSVDQANEILTGVNDDGTISFKEMDNAYALLQSLATTRNQVRNKLFKGELPATTENFGTLGRAEMNLNLAQRLYADMFLDYVDQAL